MFQNKDNSDLESNILFEGVNPEILQSFANPKNSLRKKEGAVIYQKGDLSEYIYLLIEGTVKLKYTEPDGTNIYVNRTENTFFGETELIGKTQRKTSAVADKDCKMHTFNLNELKVLIKKDNQILKNLFKNKTFNFLEEDFMESSKDLIDSETDISELIKTTEKPSLRHTKGQQETPLITTPEEEKGAFDGIITEEETDEEIIKEDSSIVVDQEESEENTTPEEAKGTFDDIVTKEETDEEVQQSNNEPSEDIIKEDNSIIIDQKESEREKLEESEGFTIEDISEGESTKSDNTETPTIQDEQKPEPTAEKEKEPSIELEKEKIETDFSDYYETLLKTTQNIFSKITIDEVAEAIADAATKLVNATGGVLYLVDKENEELKAKVLSDSSIRDIRVKFSDGLQGTAIIEKRPVISENPKENKNFNPVIEDLTGIKIKNVIYYPILTKRDEPAAVLELYNSERGKFDAREVELLNAISSSILKALENAGFVEILIQQRKILSIGEITGFIHDDIKNTLLRVRHYSSLLKKKNFSSEVNKLLEIQIGQINSIEDFLKFIDAYAHGKNVVEKSTIKVSEAVTQILNFLAEYVESRNIVIYKKIEEDAVINIDLPAMYLAFYQIAKNACDAMKDEGKIYVTSEKDGDYIKINFKDTGVGISEIIKGKLFKPFVTFGKKQKSGLGLAIAEKLVSDQGGYMMADSVLGEGATFTVALPIVF